MSDTLSDTPRTDNEAINITAAGYSVVPADFARRLERELAQVTLERNVEAEAVTALSNANRDRVVPDYALDVEILRAELQRLVADQSVDLREAAKICAVLREVES